MSLIAHLTDPIELLTEFGKCSARHVRVEDPSGDVVREGVLALSHLPPPAPEPVLLRLQSSCLFSESFRTTDCDCALQLHESLRRIIGRGGLVLYFYEEGRGAGLMRKFKAIRLQQYQNMDTLSAFKSLKIEPDMRSYEAAAAVLRRLGGAPQGFTLLTNNPSKVKGLRDLGLNVAGIEPLVCGIERDAIKAYLHEKRDVLGHKIP